jgi:hypothetical protein
MTMKFRVIFGAGLLVCAVAGCSNGAYQGAQPSISPSDPAYSENGAPRAGQQTGAAVAGAPNPNGNYAPLQNERKW